ncbi:MAG: sigma-70 family RNA polymerase sigma factor [Actinomycetota bacterium]
MPEHQARNSGGPDDVLGLYLAEIGGRPLLTREDEEALGRSIEEGRAATRELAEYDGGLPPERRRFLHLAVARCEQATRRFVEANLRLVVSIARRYRHPGLSLSDLVQEGNIGLLQAVRKFDHRRGFRFSTYATWWIRQAITRAIANSGRLIRLPVEVGDKVVRINRATTRLEAHLGRQPSMDEVAAEVGMAPARVAELLAAAADPRSVSERLGPEEGPELGETIADPAAERSLQAALAGLDPDGVLHLLSMLDERERDILCLRHGLDGRAPRSRAAVGQVLGVSGERVRQVEARAMARLRAMPQAFRAWEARRD